MGRSQYHEERPCELRRCGLFNHQADPRMSDEVSPEWACMRFSPEKSRKV